MKIFTDLEKEKQLKKELTDHFGSIGKFTSAMKNDQFQVYYYIKTLYSNKNTL